MTWLAALGSKIGDLFLLRMMEVVADSTCMQVNTSNHNQPPPPAHMLPQVEAKIFPFSSLETQQLCCLLPLMENHFPEPGWNNVRALCNSFCNATVNDSGFCPELCLPECPATCQYVLIPPTTTSVSALSTPNHSKIYTVDPFFIATFACLAIGFLAICSYAVYLKYYSTRRRPGPGPRPGSGQEVELSGQVHCESINLGAVTVEKYRKGEALFREMECAVCLNEFQDGEALRILPNCKHAFHMCCVDVWLGSNISCPMCRASIVSCMAMEPAHIDPV